MAASIRKEEAGFTHNAKSHSASIAAAPNLPATYHDDYHAIQKVRGNIEDFLRQDLRVSRLNDIHKYLWLAGRPMNARALHRQKAMEREIVVTEQADLHLVWNRSRIFIKPLPEYLLSHTFWSTYLGSSSDLRASACGFLLSYVWLICHYSDFKIALDLGLVPSHLCWPDWTAYATSFLDHIDHVGLADVNKRYRYGELRLSRLNAIYRLAPNLHSGHRIRGYLHGDRRYATFFQRNTAWLLTFFVYVTIVLTAMQVGLGTDRLGKDQGFQRASSGFTVFSILMPLGVVAIAALTFLLLFLYNLVATIKFVRHQQRHRGGQLKVP